MGETSKFLLVDGGKLIGDDGKIDGEKKCDGPPYGHPTWVGARDACASKKARMNI